MLPSTRIAVGDITLNVVDSGSGPAVLMLHGFPDSSALWRNQIPALNDAGLRVIAPDLRGFGESDKPKGVRSYAMEHTLEDLTGLLDAVNVESAFVVGHDWGAITAWAFAGLHSTRVKKLVAVSVGHPGSFARPSLEQLAKSWYAGFFQIPRLPEALITARNWAVFRRLFGSSPDYERYVEDLSRPGALTAGLNWYRANARPDRLLRPRARYPRITVPTMGVWGSKDWALGERQMTSSKDFIDAPWRYERLEAGHWIPLRRANQLNELLLDFLLDRPQ